MTRALEVSDSMPGSVQASVHHGRVTLTGTVDGAFQKHNAEHVVRHIRGVRSVADYISVAPPARAGAAGGARGDKQLEPPDEMC